MRTAMQETSLEAYFSNVLPDLGAKQRAVLRIFTYDPSMNFTNRELARELRWNINTVTPRVYELRGKGRDNPLKWNPLIIESEKRPCRVGGKRSIAWQLNPDWRPGGYKLD